MHPPPALSLRPKYSASNLLDPPVPSPSYGFRAQINQLIPRHSYFRVRVHVHQIDSVPFVNGQFSARWKFKHVHSPPSQRHGILGMVKTRSKNGDNTSPVDSVPSVVISTNTSDSSSTRVPSFSSSSSASSAIPTLQAPHLATHSDPAISPFSSNGANASRTTLHIHPPTIKTCAPTSPNFSPFTEVSPGPSPALLPSNINPHTSARGSTPYLDLKDHSVHWNQQLSTIVRLDVERDSGSILPCPFKLVVMQRVKLDPHHDAHLASAEPHRLGALHLNLSEYVGHGSVERRYLLRESKTNATLKLTIELEFISGEQNYVPPPLPKGEILNGLAGYLDGDHYRIPRGQPAYSMDMQGSEEIGLGLFSARCSTATDGKQRLTSWTASATTTTSRFEADDDDDSFIDVYQEGSDLDTPAPGPTPVRATSPAPPAFDIQRIPLAYGTKTTETLIEALFNPVKTSERNCESPFTVYVPSPPALSRKLPPSAVYRSSSTRTKNSDRSRLSDVSGSGSGLGLQGLVNLPDVKPVIAVEGEAASVYSMNTEESSVSSGSGSGSGVMSQSVHSHHSHNSLGSHHGAEPRAAGGRVKDWWKKMASASRPGTPVGRV
ncbi:hypothetical protein P691DRAFT_756733 [Macrolepiota fuliginosa MF-IS2]|uniref:C2 NT-type domain-containing protein n=1 Tax=Macrolepiota fuliginosa MF-IS2 TaxID=1400762 RepID=A0A9P5XIP4_9AGAR|nr:hypothetical protein P691DRAFT_756733 [Macrolepiota fuliginosa MF-IS2]